MSALGTSEETKELVPYWKAKWQMEQDVAASGLEHVIFRPSFVFGKGGGILPTFIRQVRYSPVVTVLGPGTARLQPIWIDDVAAHFARAIDQPEAANRTFELGGPEQLSWNDLYARIARVLGKSRMLVHVPFSVARTGARATQWIPRAPVTTDQVKMLQAGDNVVDRRGGSRDVRPAAARRRRADPPGRFLGRYEPAGETRVPARPRARPQGRTGRGRRRVGENRRSPPKRPRAAPLGTALVSGDQLGLRRGAPADRVVLAISGACASPPRWLGDSPSGPGDAPLRAGTSAARRTGNLHLPDHLLSALPQL